MPPEIPAPSDDLSSLERVRRRLYDPKAPEEAIVPHLSQSEPRAERAEAWAPPPPPEAPKKRRMSWAVLFLVIASAFFLVALAAAAYFLVFGGRAVSTDRLDVIIDAPTSIRSGDTVTLLVSVRNRNPVAALAGTLSADFPDSARAPDAPGEPFTHYEDTMEDIASGGTGERSIRVVLYGSEGERITVPVTFEYRVDGSNDAFVKEVAYEAVITSSPISVRAEAVTEAETGKPLSFAVVVRSNAEAPLDNVAVALTQHPFGFTLRKGEGPVYFIGRLEPGEERTVAVTGTVSGEASDERVFRFSAGTLRSPDDTALAVAYTTAEAAVTLAKPVLATTLSIDRDPGPAPVIRAGTPVQAILTWENALSAPVLDGQVAVKLEGDALDPSSIYANGGYYRSADRTVLFSSDTERGLANLAPGETGGGSFSFSTKSAAALAEMRNPTITATVSVTGRRAGEEGTAGLASSAVTRSIKVGTDLALSARPVRASGPAPTVDSETEYTIELSLSNTVNTVADATVTATLPSYVRFVGTGDPSLAYNATTRTVTWKAGEVAAGAGFSGALERTSFRVALLPSASQRGTSPVLVSAQNVSGVDRFTQATISFTSPELTTAAADDGTVR